MKGRPLAAGAAQTPASLAVAASAAAFVAPLAAATDVLPLPFSCRRLQLRSLRASVVLVPVKDERINHVVTLQVLSRLPGLGSPLHVAFRAAFLLPQYVLRPWGSLAQYHLPRKDMAPHPALLLRSVLLLQVESRKHLSSSVYFGGQKYPSKTLR